jgi:uncharacterized protein (TIGR02453 family)
LLPTARGPKHRVTEEVRLFTERLFDFLRELTENNDRDWFERHKARYEADVREPARAFIRAMGSRLGEVSPHFVADDRKVGGSLMRVYRDTRFSKDKTPYKTNVGISFRHAAGKDIHVPGFYLHLEPGQVFIGVGMWHPEPEPLRAVRAKLHAEPATWRAATGEGSAFRSRYRLGGDSLKRVPREYPAEHPLAEDLRRKDFIGVIDLSTQEATSPTFVDTVAGAFCDGKAFMRFLCDAVGVTF